MLLEPILICKTFAPEALEVFYGENTFLLEPYEPLRTVSELRTFLPQRFVPWSNIWTSLLYLG